MSTQPGVVTAVRWNELCPWLLLVKALRVAVLVRVLLLAAAGVWATQWGWWAIEGALLPEGVRPLTSITEPAGPPGAGIQIEIQPYDVVRENVWLGPLVHGWAWLIQPLTHLPFSPSWGVAFCFALEGVWVMAVWALFGGAIARIAALYLTRGEMLGPFAALKAATLKWPSTIAAPSFCFAILSVFVLLLLLVGLLIRVGFLAFLAGIAWPIVLALGVIVAVLAIGLLLGWPFMWSTVAAERSDAFDAVSRGYAFSFQRPLHLAFFVAVATLLGVLAQHAIDAIVDGALGAIHETMRFGAGDENEALLLRDAQVPPERRARGLAGAGGKLMRFWNAALKSVATSFPVAYLWPAAMGIYLLLRRLIDSTELGEVAFDEGPPSRGLPPLHRDPATGVPTTKSPAAAPVVPSVTEQPPVAAPEAPADPTATVTEFRSGPS
jgi:hypothetical protein